MQIYELSKTNLDLSLAEAEAQAGKGELFGEMLISQAYDFSRLAFAKASYGLIFRCPSHELLSRIEKHDWDRIIKGPFCVRTHVLPEREIISRIWRSMEAPSVDLSEPASCIHFFEREGTVLCGMLIGEADKGILRRRAHLRPSLHPTSLDPRLARAMVNLTGLRKGMICDPFCGSGGILIEAGILGFSTFGSDLEPDMVDRCRKNIAHYDVRSSLEVKDALCLSGRYDAIVTDLPYGKNSKGRELDILYQNFLRKARQAAPIIVLGHQEGREPDLTGYNVHHRFRLYVHRSMSRIILVLSPDDSPCDRE